MINFDEAQFARFEEARRDQFARDTAVLLRAKLSNAVGDAQIARLIAQAKGCGMETNSSIQNFCAIALQVGEGFHTHRKIEAALRATDRKSDALLAYLDLAIQSHVWDAVRVELGT